MSDLALMGVGNDSESPNLQVFVTGPASNQNGVTTQYINPGAGFGQLWNATEALREYIIPIDCKIMGLFAETLAAPGVGSSWTFTMRRNGAATSLVATISGAGTQANSGAAEQSFAAGDRICIESDPSSDGAPTAGAGRFSFKALWQKNRFVLQGGTSTNMGVAGALQYHTFAAAGSNIWGSTEASRRTVIPTACVIKEFYIFLSGAPGAGTSYQFSIYRNGVEESTSIVSIADTNTTVAVNLDIGVAEGDLLTFRAQSVGTPTARSCRFAVAFRPSIPRSFVIVGNGGVITATQFTGVQGNSSSSATEASVRNYLQDLSFVIKRFWVSLETAPGAGTSKIYDLRKNSADAGPTVTIANTATVGSDPSNSATIGPGDYISIEHTVSGAPAASGQISWGILCQRR